MYFIVFLQLYEITVKNTEGVIMIELDDRTLRNLQLTELELLKEIDRICKKNNIKYNIIAGTMLGAIRNKGFIPWDDDADVAMLRPEYEKFKLACEKDLDNKRFYFQDQKNTKGYRWGYGKLRMKNTIFLRENQEYMPYEQGVFLDVFPMDNIPDNYFFRSIHNFRCFCIRKIFWSEVGKHVEKNLFLKVWYAVLSCIPESMIKKHYYRFIERSNRKSTKNVRMLMFPSPTKDFGYLREWYTDLNLYQFEGLEFPGARDYDSYLKRCYNNYMEIPPVEKRKVHPVTEIIVPDYGI